MYMNYNVGHKKGGSVLEMAANLPHPLYYIIIEFCGFIT